MNDASASVADGSAPVNPDCPFGDPNHFHHDGCPACNDDLERAAAGAFICLDCETCRAVWGMPDLPLVFTRRTEGGIQ